MMSRCLTLTGQLLTQAPHEVHDQSSSSSTAENGSAEPSDVSFEKRLSFRTKTLGESGRPAAVAGHAASHAPISTQESKESFCDGSNSETLATPTRTWDGSIFP